MAVLGASAHAQQQPDTLAARRDSLPPPPALDTTRYLDWQLRQGPVDLSELRAYPRVTELVLPHQIVRLGPLADSTYTQLRRLTAARTTLTTDSLRRLYLPNLEQLDLSLTRVTTLEGLAHFGQLTEVVLARGQVDATALAAARKQLPHLQFTFRDAVRRLSRRCTHHELTVQLAEYLIVPNEVAPPVAGPGRIAITFVVDRQGFVTRAQVTEGYHPAWDAAALAATRRLWFEPGPSETARTAYLNLPLGD
ncbi:MAG: hypothetical protein SFY70_01515 [Bacteroidia bacterium]|nr:hypothetical protein [Bacteroidia bacterium]